MTEPVTVQLTSGTIRGRAREDHQSFQGIPYAAAPVGELRWRPPAPVEPWSGVRDATEPGPPAPQTAQAFEAAGSVDEDCLTLNVTVPAAERAGRPVLVWLHGGGGTNGSAAGYDPRRLAVTGDVVVVAPNFRLGVLGWFGYPGLDGSGTFGLQDQQAALRWVQREIARFGGDPANVTLIGESHGALTVAAHLTAPGSAGLFHRAVLQSPFGMLGPTPAHLFMPGLPALPPMWTPVAELEQLGAAVAVEHGWVKPDSDPEAALAQLREVPVADLLAATGAFIRLAFGGSVSDGSVSDASVLPESPVAELTAGRFHRMPLMLGTTLDEARFFVGLAGNPVTAESYPRLLAEAFGDAADEVAARYPLDRFETPNLALARISTDRAWARPAWELGRIFAAHTETWLYEFADEDAPVLFPGFPSGAQHGSELAYQFDLPGGPELSPAQQELAGRMNRYWTAFAAHGDPADPGLPDWPGAGHVQSLAPGRIGAADDVDHGYVDHDYVTEHSLDFWARMP